MVKFDISTTILAIELLCIFVTVVLLTWYAYYLHCFNYWKKKGVPAHRPRFPTGNILNSVLGKENIFIAVENFYKEFKNKGYRHAGLYFFNGPVYLPIDPAIIKSILTTDFEHFVDRGTFVDEENVPLSGNIFSMRGARWKKLRNKLTPSFSSGKLKIMYEAFQKLTENFIETIEPIAATENEINIKFVATNFTADVIFSTAFGLNSRTLQNPDSALSKLALGLQNPSSWLFLRTVILEGFKNPGHILRAVVSEKKQETFFLDLVKKTIKHRDENKIVRKDFLSSLLEIRDREGLTFNEIAAQCFLFFLAGFETSSQTISYCIHELAHNQVLQDRLRNELFQKLGKDFRKYTYEDVFTLPYLDKVFTETLRLYPVLGFFNRICVKPYRVPGTDVVIEKDTPVLLPILGLQRDPDYFPDPLKFDPERFNGDETHVPGTFLPFGEGPRFCIGMRHGKLQTKLGIAALISQFKFFPSSATPKYIELDKFSKSLGMIPAEGINVKVVKL